MCLQNVKLCLNVFMGRKHVVDSVKVNTGLLLCCYQRQVTLTCQTETVQK